MSSNDTTSPTFGQDRRATEGLMYGFNSTFITISAICLVLRLYTRLFVVRAPGADDLMAVVSFCFVTFQSSMDMYFVPLGSGVHIEDVDPVDLAQFFFLVPIMLMVLFWTLLFIRLTCILFLPRLSQEKLYLRLVYAVGVICVLNTSICFFLVLNQCAPIIDLWRPMNPNRNCRPKTYEAHIASASSGIGLFTDICIMALPIWIIFKNLHFSRAKAIQVALVFCVAFFSILCAAIRLVLITTINIAVDTTYKFPRIAVWTEAEVHCGFWVACAPAIKPLLRIASYKLGLRTSPHTTGRGRDSKYRVPSRATSPHGFHESLSGVKSSGGGRDKENWGSKTIFHSPTEIELVAIEHGRTPGYAVG